MHIYVLYIIYILCIIYNTTLASIFVLTGMLMNTESNSAAVRNLFSGAMKYYKDRTEK